MGIFSKAAKAAFIRKMIKTAPKAAKIKPSGSALTAAEIEVKQKKAAEKAAANKNREGKRTSERKASIAKKMPVSKTDIQQATTSRELDAFQKRIDNMPTSGSGLGVKAMQALLDSKRKAFDAMQSAEVDTASRKSSQAARDRKMGKPKLDMPFAKGGLTTGKKK